MLLVSVVCVMFFAIAAVAFAGTSKWAVQDDTYGDWLEVNVTTPEDAYVTDEIVDIDVDMLLKQYMPSNISGTAFFTLPDELEWVSGDMEQSFSLLSENPDQRLDSVSLETVQARVKGADELPGTGDSTNTWMWIALLGTSAALVAGGFLVRGKKRAQAVIFCLAFGLILFTAALAFAQDSSFSVNHEIKANDKPVKIEVAFVLDSVPVTDFGVYPSDIDLEVGESKDVGVYFTPSNATNQGYSINSFNASLISIDSEDGSVLTITGLANGYTQIVLTSDDGGIVATIDVYVGGVWARLYQEGGDAAVAFAQKMYSLDEILAGLGENPTAAQLAGAKALADEIRADLAATPSLKGHYQTAVNKYGAPAIDDTLAAFDALWAAANTPVVVPVGTLTGSVNQGRDYNGTWTNVATSASGDIYVANNGKFTVTDLPAGTYTLSFTFEVTTGNPAQRGTYKATVSGVVITGGNTTNVGEVVLTLV